MWGWVGEKNAWAWSPRGDVIRDAGVGKWVSVDLGVHVNVGVGVRVRGVDMAPP